MKSTVISCLHLMLWKIKSNCERQLTRKTNKKFLMKTGQWGSTDFSWQRRMLVIMNRMITSSQKKLSASKRKRKEKSLCSNAFFRMHSICWYWFNTQLDGYISTTKLSDRWLSLWCQIGPLVSYAQHRNVDACKKLLNFMWRGGLWCMDEKGCMHAQAMNILYWGNHLT